MSPKINFGEVSFLSEEKGAFVKEFTQDKEEIYVPDKVVQALKDQSQALRTGQMVQIELEGDDVKGNKPL